jgi:hypothetical protein
VASPAAENPRISASIGAMKLAMAAAAATLGMALGCSNEGAPAPESAKGACGPLRVAVEGKELTGLGPGYAVRTTKKTATVWHVEVTDGPGHSCDEVLRGGRAIKKGENTIAADIASDRSYFTGVRHNTRSLSAWSRGELVRLDGPPPTKVGDPIAICVDTDVLDDVAKGLSIKGALRGTYCGESP